MAKKPIILAHPDAMTIVTFGGWCLSFCTLNRKLPE
jgi:hypothetical protein